MPINSLSDLFNVDINGLVIDHATISVIDGMARVSGAATVFGLDNGQVTATFSVGESGLAAQAGVSFSSMTLRQMGKLQLLPKSTYQSADFPEIAFTNVRMVADKALQKITVTADGPSDVLDLGLGNLPVRGGGIHLEVRVPETGEPESLEAYLDGALQIGGGVSVRLVPPRGLHDWLLTMQSGATADLKGGLADLTALSGTAVAPMLPSDLAAATGASLSALLVQFNTSRPRINSISFSVSTASWTIIGGDILTVSRVSVGLNLDMYGPTTVAGRILATLNIFDVDVDVTLPIPFNAREWALESYPNILIPGIGTIADELGKMVGAGDLKASLPSGLDVLGSLIVQYLKVGFDPGARALSTVAFRLSSANTWTLPHVESISVTDLWVDLSIAQPLVQDQRQVTGTVAGNLQLGDFHIPVEVRRLIAGDSWVMGIGYSDISVGLPNLMPLVGIDGEIFKQTLPPSLSIISDISLHALSIEYDVNAGKLSHAAFTLGLNDVWKIIPDYLEVSSLGLSVDGDRISNDTPLDLSISMDAEVELGGVGFELSANNYASADEWLLSLKLRDDESISLDALIGWLLGLLLPRSFVLPETFPTVLCTGAKLTLASETRAFSASLSSKVTWHLPFATNSDLEIEIVNTAITIGELPTPPAAAERPYILTASGAFSFLGIFGAATFTTTNTGGDTIITVAVSNSADAIKLPGLARQMTTGAQQGNETWSQLLPAIPAGSTDFGTLTLDALINVTQKLFVLHGSSSKFGSIAFLTKKMAENDWGFFVAAKLADGFAFESLVPGLSVIDGVLTFDKGSASFAYSSLAADSVQELAKPIPQFSQALTIGGASPAPIRKGLNFYAALNFGKKSGPPGTEPGPLFSKVAKLLRGLDEKPDLVVYGFISQDTPNAPVRAVFTAELGDFTVLDALDFHGVTFKYSREATTEVTLTGDLKLTLGRDTPNPQVYPFHGNLHVTEARANFELSTQPGQSIVNPFGMTGVTVEDLRLVFSYDFVTAQPFTLQLEGKANFGTTTKFDAALYVVGKSPALVEVRLTQTPPLGIVALIASAAGVKYPEEYFDIKFLTGSAYYYDKAVDPEGNVGQLKLEGGQKIARSNGFNVQSTLSMFDQDISIAVQVQADGFTAKGKMLRPFDLGHIEFTDEDFTGSPSLFLRVLPTEKAFGFKAGFKLFKEKFGNGRISIGKYSSAGVDEARIDGAVSYDGDGEMFAGSTLKFIYSKTEGFKINDWPFSFEAFLDFARLMNGFKKGACSALTGMVFAKAVKTNFSVQPSFSSDARHYILTLRGTYSVTLLGAAQPFIHVGLPDIPVLIDRTQAFTPGSLPGLIGQAIAESAPQIVAKILNDPAKFSLFVSTVVLVNAAPGLLADLACNGGADAAEAAEAIETAETGQAAAESAAQTARAASTPLAEAEAAAAVAAAEASTAAGAAAGTGGGVVAAAAAAAAATAAAAAAAAVAARRFWSGGSTKPPEARQLDKPALASIGSDEIQLFVTWQDVVNAAAYSAELMQGTRVVDTVYVSDSSLRANFPIKDLKPGAYAVHVRANAPNYKESVSDDTSFNLLGEVSPTLACADGEIIATWNDVQPPNYEIRVARDGVVISPSPITANGGSFEPTLPGVYTVRVRATGDRTHVAGPWSNNSNPVTRLARPFSAEASLQDDKDIVVYVDFEGDGYSSQLLKDGQPFGPIVHGSKRASPAVLHGKDLAPGEYGLQVRADARNDRSVPSDWVLARYPVFKLAAPVVASLAHSKDKSKPGAVIVTLQATVQHSDRYSVQFVRSSDGTPTGCVRYAGNDVFEIVPTDILPGRYKVQLKAQLLNNYFGAGIESDWNVSTAVTTVFDKIDFETVSCENDVVTASWSPSSVASRYEFVLSDDPSSPEHPVATALAIPPAGQSAPPVSVSLDVAHLPRGTVYTAFVRPVTDAQAGDWGDWSAGFDVTVEQTIAIPPPNSSLLLDAVTGDAAAISLAEPLSLTNYTFEALVKSSRSESGQTVYNCDGAFSLAVVDGAIAFDERSGRIYGKALCDPTDGKWHHIAVVRNGDTLTIYFDGAPVEAWTAGVEGAIICRERITVGGLQPGNSSNLFTGILDELRIWNIARQPLDIQQSMHIVLDPHQQPDLLLYYNFDDGMGQELTGRGTPLLFGGAKIVSSDVPVSPSV